MSRLRRFDLMRGSGKFQQLRLLWHGLYSNAGKLNGRHYKSNTSDGNCR